MVFSSLTALEPDTTTTTLSHKHRDETIITVRTGVAAWKTDKVELCSVNPQSNAAMLPIHGNESPDPYDARKRRCPESRTPRLASAFCQLKNVPISDGVS
jgi:hypothetical protein